MAIGYNHPMSNKSGIIVLLKTTEKFCRILLILFCEKKKRQEDDLIHERYFSGTKSWYLMTAKPIKTRIILWTLWSSFKFKSHIESSWHVQGKLLKKNAWSVTKINEVHATTCKCRNDVKKDKTASLWVIWLYLRQIKSLFSRNTEATITSPASKR